MTTTEATRAPWIEGDRLLGCLREFTHDRLGFLERASKLGPVVGFHLGSRVFHLVSSPEGVQRVLVDNAPNYGKETRGQELLKTVLGNGLLTSEGPEWRRQRRMAQPAFHRERIAGFLPLMTDATSRLLDGWTQQLGTVVDVPETLSRLTLEIVGRALMSVDLSDSASEVGRALTTVLEQITERSTSVLDFLIGTELPTPRNRRLKAAIASLDAVVARTIGERRELALRGEEPARPDLLTLLMRARDEETGEGLSDSLLRDQVMTMILAGHETTSNALSWTFYLLSKNPAVERRARAEVAQVLGGRTPSLDDLPQLRLVRAIVEEAMRLYPPVWTLARSVLADDVIDGVPIPAGSYVFASPWITQRHPDLWENPEGFDPERFLEPDPLRPRFAYFPFGGGSRQCIGNTFALMEAQVIVALTLARVRLDLEPGQRAEPEPLITLRPKHGLKMRLASPARAERSSTGRISGSGSGRVPRDG